MLKLLAGILIGNALAWITMLYALSQYGIKHAEKDNLIREITEENKQYKERLEWWHRRFDSD